MCTPHIVHVAVPEQMARNGELTEGQCESLAKGTTVTSIEDQYGLPKGFSPAEENSGWVTYRMSGTGDRLCMLQFNDGGLDRITMELPVR